eukprot:3987122-Amphidinium_carterae.1
MAELISDIKEKLESEGTATAAAASAVDAPAAESATAAAAAAAETLTEDVMEELHGITGLPELQDVALDGEDDRK